VAVNCFFNDNAGLTQYREVIIVGCSRPI